MPLTPAFALDRATLSIDTADVDPARAREIERRLRLLMHDNRVIVVRLAHGLDVTASLAGVLLRVHRSLSWRNGQLVVVADQEACRTLAAMGLTESFEVIERDGRDRG